MSESLSEDQLAELIRSGRINTSKSAAKKRQSKKSKSDLTAQKSVPKARDSLREVEQPAAKEPDPEWLRAEKEKAERNIAAQRQDKRRREELREASRF